MKGRGGSKRNIPSAADSDSMRAGFEEDGGEKDFLDIDAIDGLPDPDTFNPNEILGNDVASDAF